MPDRLGWFTRVQTSLAGGGDAGTGVGQRIWGRRPPEVRVHVLNGHQENMPVWIFNSSGLRDVESSQPTREAKLSLKLFSFSTAHHPIQLELSVFLIYCTDLKTCNRVCTASANGWFFFVHFDWIPSYQPGGRIRLSAPVRRHFKRTKPQDRMAGPVLTLDVLSDA